MNENTEIITQEEEKYLSVAQVKSHVALVKDILNNVLIEGIITNGKIVKDGHYGKLPGCGNKLVLLKPGAEKLCLAFNIVPKYNINILPVAESDLVPPGHRDYEVTCELFNRQNGHFVGQGMGSCTTLETKYQFRTKWVNNKPEKEPNPCIADVYNTVKKMACKRALVHAVIQCLAVGDIFMQDIEDMKPEDLNNGKNKPDMKPPQSKSETDTNKITNPQMKKIQAMFKEINPSMGSEAKQKMASNLIDKELSSMSDLTKTDAMTLIDGLEEIKKMSVEKDQDHKAEGDAPF